ncbi:MULTISPECIES: uracil-DNA glycosylase family protein [Halobacterium]|uniref:Uracil-DNA glycosylase superfamily protein n=4 Tax=Halobacterium salinarum TaxID=2242 RepID=A0A510N5A3_HALSA|nr:MULTISPECIES: uracil-DNA glycosylase family protein [Halobacterium]MBB6090034.1 uracil-DNA glycosylase family 4 [Halobacterium salinarum]MCF2208284.1 uracil-DNA glycosylase family protein [Halobacterium salinarum]MCF2238421.1 uracil-DNA glycosylase family protein [Halobacterium salinarum]MCF2240493.1 uracil-DNA glycosylase family protein [Halobacterium salinarum]MDL0120749.1 uracil-DNA glycosylase family protein [Halobacterium salinarum]
MQNVTDRTTNPFDMQPPCESFVPGHGDANADIHVIGDHPGVHGGTDTGTPFTGSAAGDRLRSALRDAGVLTTAADDTPPIDDPDNSFFSYLHPCVPEGTPTPADYRELEPFFDAELRAITAHVLLPVGERATTHVLETCTAIDPADASLEDRHATELHGSGWLVVPCVQPDAWSAAQETAYVEALRAVMATDYQRQADLGRFLVGPEPYTVR